MLEQPPSIYMKILVMIDLVGTLRTELSQRTHLLSRLQRTKLHSCKPTQDCNLFDIGCKTFLYQLINIRNNRFCAYFCLMFRKSREECQQVRKFDDFRHFCYFQSRFAVSRYWYNELIFWQYCFFMSYQRNITRCNQFSKTKKLGPPYYSGQEQR